MSEYDDQAAAFLAKHDMAITITRKSITVKWDARRYEYNVIIFRQSNPQERLRFPFYGSVHDMEQDKDITAYDVLSCIGADSTTPNTVSEYFEEYGGNAESIKENKQAVSAVMFGRRLREFFTPEELEDLVEIR